MAGMAHSPANRAQQFAFLRDAHEGPDVWRGLCQSLARQAARLPAVAPSAAAAAAMTPARLRVHDIADVRRGMVAFWGTPHDDNPFDHVTTVAGFDGPHTLDAMLNWTNDAVEAGSVDLVRGSFFPDRWGDPFMFAAPVLNGFWLPGYGPEPDAPGIGPNLDAAIAAQREGIAAVRKAIRHHRAAKHPKRVAALADNLAEMREALTALEKTGKRFPRNR